MSSEEQQILLTIEPSLQPHSLCFSNSCLPLFLKHLLDHKVSLILKIKHFLSIKLQSNDTESYIKAPNGEKITISENFHKATCTKKSFYHLSIIDLSAICLSSSLSPTLHTHI